MELNRNHIKFIQQSKYISRDLSWLKFNWRVLDQCRNLNRSIFDRLKFLAISTSNLTEFYMVRLGSLYNYLDYGKERVDYCGLREKPFRNLLLKECQKFYKEQGDYFAKMLVPEFEKNGFDICNPDRLTATEKVKVNDYFRKTIYPMLTPMLFDGLYHSFPTLINKALTLGVLTEEIENNKVIRNFSFVQIPQNLPRFFETERNDMILFVPIEEIIRANLQELYKNVTVLHSTLFRVIRNADVTITDIDDVELDFLDEVIKKLSSRRTARVVAIEVEEKHNKQLCEILKEELEIDELNIFSGHQFLDYNSLWQLIGHPEFRAKLVAPPTPVQALSLKGKTAPNIFELIKQGDILLHHPYNSIEPVLELLEEAADDKDVLAIKITIYRLAKKSRITQALLKAARNGKHVSVLFEVKARFDEENNIREAQKLQTAGCHVIYGVGKYKTHTKLMLVVRKEQDKIQRYVHMSSGNYNEDTARIYTDVAVLSAREDYANDVAELFNFITGHSKPSGYQYLLTSPYEMRKSLIDLIKSEAENAQKGLPSGIVIKVNSLEDKAVIDALYEASQAGVKIELIVRGICCLRPQRTDLSENITVRSLVGEFLEHARLYYFLQAGNPKIYGGSADMMNRSFDRRIEALFLIVDEKLKQEAINILAYNLKGNANSYLMDENGEYAKRIPNSNEKLFNVHKEFFKVTEKDIAKAKIFEIKNNNTTKTAKTKENETITDKK